MRALNKLARHASGPELVRHLADILQDTSYPPDVQDRALQILQSRLPAAAPVLAEILHRIPRPELREAAIAALEGSECSREVLMALLAGDRDPRVRARAALALGQLPCPETARALLRAIREDCPIVQRQAAIVLQDLCNVMDCTDLVGDIIEIMGSADRTLLYWLTRVLASSASPEAIPGLQMALDSTDADTRICAIQGLEKIGLPEATDLILKGLQDRWFEVREWAVRALRNVPSPPIAPILRALKDRSARVRAEAARTTQVLGIEAAVPLLADLAKSDPDVTVRMRALMALEKMGNRELLPLLIQIAASDPAEVVRLQAIVAAAAIGGSDILPDVERIWEELPGTLRANVLLALGKMGLPVGGLCRRSLKERFVQEAAVGALWQTEGLDAVLEIWLAGEIENTTITKAARWQTEWHISPDVLVRAMSKDPELIRGLASMATGEAKWLPVA